MIFWSIIPRLIAAIGSSRNGKRIGTARIHFLVCMGMITFDNLSISLYGSCFWQFKDENWAIPKIEGIFLQLLKIWSVLSKQFWPSNTCEQKSYLVERSFYAWTCLELYPRNGPSMDMDLSTLPEAGCVLLARKSEAGTRWQVPDFPSV